MLETIWIAYASAFAQVFTKIIDAAMFFAQFGFSGLAVVVFLFVALPFSFVAIWIRWKG
jgi:hypothetical protein